MADSWIKTYMVFPLILIVLGMILTGIKRLGLSYKTVREEAHKMFMSRVFKKEEEVKKELYCFFRDEINKIRSAGLCFLFAFIILFSLFLWSPIPWWKLFILNIVIFLGPFSAVILKFFDIIMLKNDIMEKFS